jgi:hypothetical protein
VAPKAKKIELEHEDIVVPFNRLHFDPVNPRGESEPDEEKIRNYYGARSETVLLATHIAENGQNPLDRIAIIKHPALTGHYVVREGNRRLCAMQLLRDPERAPTLAAKKTYKRLKEEGVQIPGEIHAVLFHEQPKARVWMSVKHEGGQGGVGTLTWGPTQKARFNREGETSITRPKNPNRQAEALIAYAKTRSLVTPHEASQISVTTITRYLPNVRTALALLNSEDCETNAPKAEFDQALKRFLTDAIGPGSHGVQAAVNSRSTSSQRKDYAERLRADGVSPKTRDLPSYNPATTSSPAKKSPSTVRSATDPRKRKHLIPSGFSVPVKDNVLLRLVSEGKYLNPDDARFSCNYLNRVILERVIHLYAKKQGVGAQGEFSEVVTRIITFAKKTSTPPSKSVVLVLTKTADKKSSYSYEIMSNSVHGGSIPSGADNRSNWETIQPALEYLLNHLK